MSKGSQQQPMTTHDRTAPVAPKPKQAAKADANVNGAKLGEAVKPASAPKPRERELTPPPSAEDDFFARGEANSSFPPVNVSAPDLEDDSPESKPLTPAQLERRARLRRIVGGVVGAAAVMTAVVGAKALAAPPAKVTALEGALNVPHQVVASIALATPDEPAGAKAATAEKGMAPDPAAVPGIDPAPVGDKAAAPAAADEPGTKPGSETPSVAAAPTARRLPVIDVEIPPSSDPTTDKQWESAAQKLASQDFKAADSAFAELGKRSDVATREAARLARAVWWTANGRQNEVKPVIVDLAANATTPSVRHHAQNLLSAN
jgi:hypothetical protein